jgi:hypothetical protein
MKQQVTVCGSGSRRERGRAWEPRVHVTQRPDASRDAFNRRLDAVVLRALERSPQQGSGRSADEDYAMRWAIARYLRTQSRSVKGAHHVAA